MRKISIALLCVKNSKKIFASFPKDKRFFFVNGKIQADEVGTTKLQDFKPFKTKTGTFIPLLFGQYAGLIGYKMQQVNKKWILDHTKQ